MSARQPSVRLFPLLLLLALSIATDVVLRPVWLLGPATPDPPLLLVIWLALFAGRGHTRFVVILVSLLRSTEGLDSFLASWLPMTIAAESMLMLRRGLFLVPLPRRLLAAFVANTLALVSFFLLAGSLDFASLLGAAKAGVVGSLLALLLFPILDALAPILISANRQVRRA